MPQQPACSGTFPRTERGGRPLRESVLGQIPRMAELFDITDALEILSKLGEPDLLDRSAAALKSLRIVLFGVRG